MLPSELAELVRTVQRTKAENQHLEVKAARQDCPQKLYDTLSSFSNQEGGGVILFGMAEDQGFAVVGVYDPQDLQHQVNEQCKQMQPVVRPLFTVAEIDGKNVISAEIPEIEPAEKPCYYRGTGRMKGSYVRVGGADEPVSEYEIYSYEMFRRQYRDDIRVVERATLDSLSKVALERYIQSVKQDKPNLASINDDQAYELLSITRNGVPSLAAVMMFSPFPQAYFPQYSITAVVVPGYEVGDLGTEGSRFLDNKRIEGNIPEMLEQSLAFVRKNMSIRTVIDEATGRRVGRPEYPLVAIREAVLNALVHRDYSIHTEGTPIQISFFKNRLEISNPGGLYGRLSVGQLGQVRPDTRNPVLASMLESVRLVENRYSGIPTIRREMKAAELPDPEFYSERGTFRVVFFNGLKPETIFHTPIHKATREKELLRFCHVPRSREEIAGFLKIGTAYYAMKRYVIPLVHKGLMAMTMPEKPRSRNQRYFAVRGTSSRE